MRTKKETVEQENENRWAREKQKQPENLFGDGRRQTWSDLEKSVCVVCRSNMYTGKNPLVLFAQTVMYSELEIAFEWID